MQHLTWYINDTLVGEEHARAHRHISDCLICQKELQCQQYIASAVGSPANITSNAALALSEIDSRLNAKAVGCKTVWYYALDVVARTPKAMRIVAASQAVILIAALSFLWTNNLSEQSFTEDASESYRVLSSSEAPRGDIRIIFSSQTTLAEQHQLLQSINAHIVSGPTQRGVFTLELTKPFSSNKDSNGSAAADLKAHIESNSQVIFVALLGDLSAGDSPSSDLPLDNLLESQ